MGRQRLRKSRERPVGPSRRASRTRAKSKTDHRCRRRAAALPVAGRRAVSTSVSRGTGRRTGLPSRSADRRAVETVDIGIILHGAVIARDGCEVRHVHGDRAGQLDFAVVASGEKIADLAAAPALVLAEQDLGQASRILHAHAAMAQCPIDLGEKIPLGRIVHVDIMLVGETKLERSEHVVVAGGLKELELPDIDARANRPGRDRRAGHCR